jgi:hypothetical protein
MIYRKIRQLHKWKHDAAMWEVFTMHLSQLRSNTEHPKRAPIKITGHDLEQIEEHHNTIKED